MHDTLEAVASEADQLFHHTSGPRDARVLIVGEAWGAEEEAHKLPFIGPSGDVLFGMLGAAGFFSGDYRTLRRDDLLKSGRILLTNVVSHRPAGNDFKLFLGSKGNLDDCTPLYGLKAKPLLKRGVETLGRLIRHLQPQLIIAAGNIPLWALSNHAGVAKSGTNLPTGITSWRGSQTFTRADLGSIPLLPIIHPASILREWGFRNPTINDLRRAAGFLSGAASWERPKRTQTYIKPTWETISGYLWQLRSRLQRSPVEVAVDLETYKRKWVSTIGLADERSEICIPLLKPLGAERVDSYLTEGQEITLWQELKYVLEHPNIRIIGQNFIYDTEWFHRYYNIKALVHFDTMVAHHLLFPGTPKRLDYLASLYCDHYCYWKDESGDWNQLPEDPMQYWTYNTKDTRATFDCAGVLKAAIKDAGLESLYQERIESWLESRRMSLQGVNFNSSLQKAMKLSLFEEGNELSQWLLTVVPDDLAYTSSGKPWFDSPKATMELLYTHLGLPVIHEGKGEKRRPTSNDKALAELTENPAAWFIQPILERLRHLRSLGVLVKNILSARVGSDGRMRCTFNIAHPETLRWSSNANGFGEGANLQNVTKGDKEERELDLEEETLDAD